MSRTGGRMPAQTFSGLWDQLLSEGVVSLSTDELADRAGATRQATFRAVHDAKAANRLFSPAKGLYVLVPPQYRSRGTVPADWYIDDMMRHMGRTYYVGFLTAAARHGASHQASRLFQVLVDAITRDRDIGRSRLRFYRASDIDDRATEEMMGPTGRMTVATPETCVLDFAERPELGGGIGTILEVLPELDIDAHALIQEAEKRSRAVRRRCGWMLSRTHPDLDLQRLREMVEPDVSSSTPLVPGGETRGIFDETWGVRVNTLVVDEP